MPRSTTGRQDIKASAQRLSAFLIARGGTYVGAGASLAAAAGIRHADLWRAVDAMPEQVAVLCAGRLSRWTLTPK